MSCEKVPKEKIRSWFESGVLPKTIDLPIDYACVYVEFNGLCGEKAKVYELVCYDGNYYCCGFVFECKRFTLYRREEILPYDAITNICKLCVLSNTKS